MGLSRQESWSGLPLPSPGNLPDPGTEPESLHWQEDSVTEPSREAHITYTWNLKYSANEPMKQKETHGPTEQTCSCQEGAGEARK